MVDPNEPIWQGDFISSCPIVIPSVEIGDELLATIETDVKEYDVVIMSQSCDLEHKKIDLVLVCPVFRLKESERNNNFLKSKKVKEKIRQGTIPGYHLLDKSNKVGLTDYMIVDFHNVYGVPFDFLIDFVKKRGKRLRLLPPYREHLSQAFARFFMRVGLPVDIPSFI